ncbi:hypothetical protein [Bythopirellula polymerisocia]|nr:hypothetical protein [Bythopirellula polymerisocia]
MLKTSLLLALLGGCQGSVSPYDYIPVSGQVTYEDGTPIPSGGFVLKFYALDAPKVENMRPRPAQADIDSNGNFECATSYKYGDGLIPGKHRVVIFYATDKNGKLLVPKEYIQAGDSPLIIDTADAPLEIKVPKP